MENPREVQLSEEPLSMLLLNLEKSKTSAELRIRCSIGSARLLVRAGELADASFGELTGVAAARTLLALREGRCLVTPNDGAGEGPIHHSLSELVKENKNSGVGGSGVKVKDTLSMGSRIPLVDQIRDQVAAPKLEGKPAIDHKKTLQSRVPSQSRMPAAAAFTDSERAAPVQQGSVSKTLGKESFTKTSMGQPHKPVPARLMRQDSTKPRRTGYSSRPPAALAEEYVPLPRSLRRLDALPKFEGITATRVTPLEDPPSATRKGREQKALENTLGTATVVPDDGLQHPAVFLSEASDLPPDSPSSGISEESTPRPSSNRDRIEFDEEVYEAAEGQLSDSEMPLPSTRLSMEALHQLQALNAAISSRPSAPGFAAQQEVSTAKGSDPPKSSNGSSSLALELSTRPSWDPPSRPRAYPSIIEASGPKYQELSARAQSSSPPPHSSSRIPHSETQQYTGPQSLTQVPGSVPDPSALPGSSRGANDGGLPRVGRYEVLSRLKRGGMGSVYMCRLTTTAGFRRLFAMKVLHGHLASQPKSVDAFFHEARVLGGLHHRNIVGIADVGAPAQPYIVLDYVEGGSLAEIYRATRKKPRDPRLIVTVILDALSGLHAAHVATDEHGTPLRLVHCDVTPHNLLVGLDGTCRLTDFGIARTGKVDPRTEVVQGKPGYLAPERILKKPSDLRSDIFSLGVVLYAGLTGVEPFAGANSEETIHNILNRPFVPPSQTGFRPSPALDLICMKALARDPAERFQSAEEMAIQLQRVAERERLLGTPSDVATWVRSSLGPTLKARRVASMRGAKSAEEQGSWATIPPPEVAETSFRSLSSQPPSSKSEETGRLDSPPSSRGFGDHTQRLDGDTASARSARSRLLIYLLLTGLMAIIVWAVMRPEAFSGLLRVVPAATQEINSAPQTPVPPPAELKGSTTDSESEDKIVIPEISPASQEAQ